MTLALIVGLGVMSFSLVSQALAKQRYDEREVERIDIYARGVASLVSNHFRGPLEHDRSTIIDLLQQSVSTQFGVRAIDLYVIGSAGGTKLLSVGEVVEVGAPAHGHEGLDADASDLGRRLVIDALVPTFGGPPNAPRPVLRVTAIPESWLNSGVVQQMVLLSLGIIGLMLLAGNTLLDGKILRPMRGLREAARRIAQGDLQTPIPEDGPLEFKALAADFNAMTESLDRERTENARQADALRRSEQLAAVGKLAAGVAHEVGNPLAALQGYLEFLIDPREGLSDKHRDLLRTMTAQTGRIQHIVAQLLDYSRPRGLQLETVALSHEIQRVLDLLSMDRRLAGVEVRCAPIAEFTVHTDAGVLQQILVNLLLNAAAAIREHRGDGGVIEVTVARGDGVISILVRDDGPGIESALLEKIFEPFFTTRAAGEGTGLGLAMSRGLAERLRGSLRALSPDPDAPADLTGAAFELRLPEEPAPPAA